MFTTDTKIGAEVNTKHPALHHSSSFILETKLSAICCMNKNKLSNKVYVEALEQVTQAAGDKWFDCFTNKMSLK